MLGLFSKPDISPPQTFVDRVYNRFGIALQGIAYCYNLIQDTPDSLQNFLLSTNVQTNTSTTIRPLGLFASRIAGVSFVVLDNKNLDTRGESHDTVHKKLYDIASSLIRNNPELEFFDPTNKNVRELYHFVFGVASGINPSDLKSFGYARDNECLEMEEKIEARTGIMLPWKPSKETLEKILEQVPEHQLALPDKASLALINALKGRPVIAAFQGRAA